MKTFIIITKDKTEEQSLQRWLSGSNVSGHQFNEEVTGVITRDRTKVCTQCGGTGKAFLKLLDIMDSFSVKKEIVCPFCRGENK